MTFTTIDLTQSKNAKLAEYIKALAPERRARMHERISISLWGLVRNHFQRYAPRNHKTATRLGATPTGFIYPLAFNNTTRESDASGAAVVIRSDPANNFDARALRRAYGPLTIKPRNKKALTIPVHPLAYGRSVADLPASLALFRPRKKGGEKSNVLAANIDGKVTPLYVLVRSATIPQDETLLPTNEEVAANAARAVAGFLRKRKAFGI